MSVIQDLFQAVCPGKLSLHEAVHEMTRQAIPVIYVSFPQNKSLCNLLHLQKNLYVIYYIIT